MERDDNGARSEPSNHTSPAVGSISFSTERPIVLLPEPDSPTRPSTSPCPISKLTSSTARTGRSPWPKYFLSPRTASIGALTVESRLAYAPVVPAKAGTHFDLDGRNMDSRFRGNDNKGSRVESPVGTRSRVR